MRTTIYTSRLSRVQTPSSRPGLNVSLLHCTPSDLTVEFRRRHDPSPSLSLNPPSREVRSQQLLPSLDPFTVHAPPGLDVNHNEALTVQNDTSTARGRYSMRMRQPRQLKPYAIERLEYKHQLKHHPDAIVKFTDRRIPAESLSVSDEADTDGAAENSAYERRSDEARMSRSKGKKTHYTSARHPSASSPVAHRRMSAVQPSSGPLVLGGIFAELSIPDIDGDGSLGELEAVTWYPAHSMTCQAGQVAMICL